MKNQTPKPIAEVAPIILTKGRPSIPRPHTPPNKTGRIQLKIEVVEADGTFALAVRSAAGLSLAGYRLQRGETLPIDAWDYFDKAEAVEAATKLQGYIDTYYDKPHNKRRSTK